MIRNLFATFLKKGLYAFGGVLLAEVAKWLSTHQTPDLLGVTGAGLGIGASTGLVAALWRRVHWSPKG